MRLRGPATWELFEQLPEKRFQQMVDDQTGELTDVQRGGRMAVAVGSTYATVTADLRSGEPSINVEFSAPSLVDGHNAQPLPLALLTEVCHAAWSALANELTGVPRFDQLRVSRLDIARTFLGVQNICDTVAALSQLRASRVRIDTLQRGRRGQWQSLTRGNRRSWRAVLYGKAEEMRERASQTSGVYQRALLLRTALEVEDHLRYELQLRDVLREAKLTDHTHVDEQALRSLAEHYFNRSRFSEVIDSGPRRARELIGSLAPGEQRGVLALLGADLLDMAAPMTHNPKDHYRALLRQLQLTSEDLLPGLSSPRRLDFATGLEVAVPNQPAEDPPVSRP